MSELTFPDFTNKLLTVHLAAGQHNYVVYSPVFKLQAGRWFIVGNTPKGVSTGDWDESIEVALAWDQVSAYRVFDTAAQYIERYARFNALKKKA
jgi:hypothetical protein